MTIVPGPGHYTVGKNHYTGMFVELRIASVVIERQKTPARDEIVSTAINNDPMLNGIVLKNDD